MAENLQYIVPDSNSRLVYFPLLWKTRNGFPKFLSIVTLLAVLTCVSECFSEKIQNNFHSSAALKYSQNNKKNTFNFNFNNFNFNLS